MFSTSSKLRRWLWYVGFHSKPVPHTYSVWETLPSHVYWWRNRYPQIAKIDVYKHGVDISLIYDLDFCPKNRRKSLNTCGIQDSTQMDQIDVYSGSSPYPPTICTNLILRLWGIWVSEHTENIKSVYKFCLRCQSLYGFHKSWEYQTYVMSRPCGVYKCEFQGIFGAHSFKIHIRW